VGGTAPLAGDASFARGATAYLAHLNARGGVRGRTIRHRVVDDHGDPALALAAARQLVERDGAFAIFGTAGTAAALAVRSYLATAKVPHLLPASDFRPSHRAEGWIYGSYLARARPGARIGVLHATDGDGRELLAGLRQGIARSRARIVATERVELDADVAAQVEALAASGADVLALFVPASQAADASAAATGVGWRPLHLVAADAAGARRWPDGALTIGWAKDPADPRWRDDEALRPYRSILRGRSVGHVQGMAAAFELGRLLRATGAEPTRAAALAQLRRLSDAANPFLLPGVTVRTSATDAIPIDQAMLRRSTAGRWRGVGSLWRHGGG
jgi:branched-chain amino acid transport system substrate-binding protein